MWAGEEKRGSRTEDRVVGTGMTGWATGVALSPERAIDGSHVGIRDIVRSGRKGKAATEVERRQGKANEQEAKREDQGTMQRFVAGDCGRDNYGNRGE